MPPSRLRMKLAATAALVLPLLQMPVAIVGEERLVVFSSNFTCSSWMPYWSTSMGSIAGPLTVQVRSLDDPPIRASYAALANAEQASRHWLNSYYCGASKAQLSVGGPTLVSKTVKVGLSTTGTNCSCSSSLCTTYAYVHCGAAVVGCNPATQIFCNDQSGTGKFEVTITKIAAVKTTAGVLPPTTPPPTAAAATTTPPPPTGPPVFSPPAPVTAAPNPISLAKPEASAAGAASPVWWLAPLAAGIWAASQQRT